MEYLVPSDNMYGLDVEGNGLTPTKLWCCCVVHLKTGERESFTEAKSFIEWLKTTKDAILIGHNILKADLPWLNHLWKTDLSADRCIDTFVLSMLFNPGLPKPDGMSGTSGTHSLEAWGLRINSPKGDYNDWSKYTDEMLAYCFQDVELTLKVYTALAKQLKLAGFSEQSIALEHAVAPIIGQQQLNGFHFDTKGAANLLSTLRSKREVLEKDIKLLFSSKLVLRGEYRYRVNADGRPHAHYTKHTDKYPVVKLSDDRTSYEVYDYEDFNIGSPAQRIKRLLELGYVPTAFTPTGAPKVDEDALVEFAKVSGIKEVQYIAEWLVLEGRANMIQTWLNNLGSDNRIHGNVFTCGAKSRRMKHSSPNTANIPGLEAKYGREARALWTSRPGRVLVGVDAASLEGRMLLHHLNNPDAEDFFVNKKPHRLNADALIAAGIFIGSDPHAQYQKAKTLLYAFLYGASDRKLASTVGATDTSVGAIIRTTLARNVPGLAELVKRVQEEYHSNAGLLQCIDGGYVRCHSSHAALNYKLQPDGAILMKQALVIADKELKHAKLDYLFVGNIHDEWQLDCKQSDSYKIGEICTEAIRTAGTQLQFNVAQSGEFKVGFTWAETH